MDIEQYPIFRYYLFGSGLAGLGLSRKARSFLRKSTILGSDICDDALLAAYAYAVAEENACGGRVVTAPTCGSCGVLPSVLCYFKNRLGCNRMDIVRALATAGLFGNIVKTNGSISGAAVGCQGEVGTACAMAAAAATQFAGRESEADRVCRRNGARTPFWPDL